MRSHFLPRACVVVSSRSFRFHLLACVLVASSSAAWADATVPVAARPLRLPDAISAALAHNPDLQSFDFVLRAQDARTEQAGLKPAPEVFVGLENFAGSGDVGRLQGAEATFALSQVIELGGKRNARVSTAQAGRSALDIERQAMQLDVLAEVTRRFIAVARHQQLVRLADSASALADKTVAASERRVNAAKSPHAELDRARIAQDRLRLEARAARVALDTARQQLAATWGESQPQIDGQVFGAVQVIKWPCAPVGST